MEYDSSLPRGVFGGKRILLKGMKDQFLIRSFHSLRLFELSNALSISTFNSLQDLLDSCTSLLASFSFSVVSVAHCLGAFVFFVLFSFLFQ